jgi:hypothetical protein
VEKPDINYSAFIYNFITTTTITTITIVTFAFKFIITIVINFVASSKMIN